jgi:hypothetical protein
MEGETRILGSGQDKEKLQPEKMGYGVAEREPKVWP